MEPKIVILSTIFIINSGICNTVSPAESSYATSFTGGKRGIYGPAGISKFDTQDGSTTGKTSTSLSNPMNPFLSLRPFLPAKPTFFPPFIDPNLFVDQKAQMLDSSFSSPGFANTPTGNVASKPEQIMTYPPMPIAPSINPNVFIDKKTELLNQLFGQFPANEKPISTAQRDLLGEYSASSSIKKRLVPTQGLAFAPVLSPMDKIKFFSDKKTQFLDTLFKTINITAQPVTESSSIEDGPSVTAKPTIVPPSFWIPNYQIPAVNSESTLNNIVQRQVASPVTPLWTPVLPPIAKAYADKKADFINKLFSSIAPSSKTSAQPGSSLISEEGMYSSSIESGIGTTVKPTIVPPSFWVPDYKKPIITGEPTARNTIQRRLTPQPAPMWSPLLPPKTKAYSDKKADFLNKLFTNIVPSLGMPSDSGNALNSVNPTIKPTIVPPNFWVPYKQITTSSSSPESDLGIQYSSDPVRKGSDALLAVSFAPLINGVPVVDQTYFISKKNDFLSSLFHSLNLTTPSSADSSADDMAANMYFASQLFKYLNLTGMTSKSNEAYSITKRNSHDSEHIRISNLKKLLQIMGSSDDTTNSENSNLLAERSIPAVGTMSTYLSAKDSFVENILTELTNIKNSMLQATNELIQQQKAASTSATPLSPGKKPGASYASPYKMWGKASPIPPTPDPIQPFATKMIYLGQIFDTLTQLERNMSQAIDQDSTVTSVSQKSLGNEAALNSRAVTGDTSNANAAALQVCANYGELPPAELTSLADEPVNAESLTNDALLDKSKKIFCHLLLKLKAAEESGASPPGPVTRSIKMAVHQGYQSFPPGSEELLQAGGGGEPGQQEGGGLKLQIKVPA